MSMKICARITTLLAESSPDILFSANMQQQVMDPDITYDYGSNSGEKMRPFQNWQESL